MAGLSSKILSFKFGVLNVRSLLSKLDAFADIVGVDGFNILAITETWFIADVFMNIVNIPYYKFLHSDKGHMLVSLTLKIVLEIALSVKLNSGMSTEMLK